MDSLRLFVHFLHIGFFIFRYLPFGAFDLEVRQPRRPYLRLLSAASFAGGQRILRAIRLILGKHLLIEAWFRLRQLYLRFRNMELTRHLQIRRTRRTSAIDFCISLKQADILIQEALLILFFVLGHHGSGVQGLC